MGFNTFGKLPVYPNFSVIQRIWLVRDQVKSLPVPDNSTLSCMGAFQTHIFFWEGVKLFLFFWSHLDINYKPWISTCKLLTIMSTAHRLSATLKRRTNLLTNHGVHCTWCTWCTWCTLYMTSYLDYWTTLISAQFISMQLYVLGLMSIFNKLVYNKNWERHSFLYLLDIHWQWRQIH